MAKLQIREAFSKHTLSTNTSGFIFGNCGASPTGIILAPGSVTLSGEICSG